MRFMILIHLYIAIIVYRAKCQSNKIFDYIIVGAGSSGSTLAARLTEGNWSSVLLLEAGEKAPFLTEVPLFGGLFHQSNSSLSWNYITQPQSQGCQGYVHKACDYYAGRAIGGGSAINYMSYVRGNAKDFDRWESQGAKNWSYKDVLPYFKKSEGLTIKHNIDEVFHGTRGPLTVSRPHYKSALTSAFLESAKEMGYNIVDVNGATQTGFSGLQATIRDGYRCSTEKAYLQPAYKRENLLVISGAYVTKIEIDPVSLVTRGVHYTKASEKYFVEARREVIVSAGAIRSPQLLMLSGVGPKKHLRDNNISVILDSPSVGLNFQDHIASPGIPFRINETFGINVSAIGELYEQAVPLREGIKRPATLKGLLSSPLTIEGVGYVKSPFEEDPGDYPDVILYGINGLSRSEFYSKEIQDYFESLSRDHVFQMVIANVHPRQRGSIRLSSANPFKDPIFCFDYLGNKTDLNILTYGLKTSYQMGLTTAWRKLGAVPFNKKIPGCGHLKMFSDKYFECYAKIATLSFAHGSGSCKMGAIDDDTAVLDPFLRVKGVKRLRVVDTSISPEIVSANTYAVAVMIGEKAAFLIKNTISP